ncbi:hypothetical protein P9112_000925 [Eukaryota sp. TZLM1-RC]
MEDESKLPQLPLLGRRHSEVWGEPAGIDFTETLSPERPEDEGVSIDCIDYSKHRFEYFRINNLDHFLDQQPPNWVGKVLSAIARHLEFHPLTIEDIMDTDTRPKVDHYEHYLYISMCLQSLDESQQIAFLVKENLLITIIEKNPQIFSPIRRRLRYGRSKERFEDISFLLYSLIDVVVDKTFSLVNSILDDLEMLENISAHEPTISVIDSARKFGQTALVLKRTLWSSKEVVSFLQGRHSIASETAKIYLADVMDHILLLENQCEDIIQLAAGVSEKTFSYLNLRQNDVQKVLSIVATIFLPLTFVSSVYGMNVRVLPLASDEDAIWFFLAFCVIIVGFSLLLFKKRGWI